MALEKQSPEILKFGTFEVDLRAGELRKQGKRVKLQDQPSQVLAVLLQRPGDVVTREEMRSQIWPEDTFVDFDNSLNTAINKLREALGDSANNPHFIETLPRRGYRFLLPVSSNDCMESLVSPSANVISASTSSVWKVTALIVIGALVGVASGIFFWRSRKAQRLTEKDTIVLADFTNTTGDPVFDETLKQGLRVQLEQSPFLNILSDERVGEELQLMGRQKDERLTKELARDLCQRVGSKAILAGSISSLGTHYAIGLSASDCRSGDGLASGQEEADSRENVLRALSKAATRMRKRLGESLASVEKYDVPVEQATTSSLEALQAYSLGERTWHVNGAAPALPFFKRAVELDPTFVMAYAKLGVVYSGTGESTLSVDNTRKAYALRARVSERERRYLESHYYEFATGEWEKATEAYELWHAMYPRDPVPTNNLVDIYAQLGDLRKACDASWDTMRLDPNNVESYHELAWCYLTSEHLNEAETILKEAQQRKIGEDYLVWHRFRLAFLRNDEEQMERLANSHGLYGLLGFKEAYHGHIAKARVLWQQEAKSKSEGERGQWEGGGTSPEIGLEEALLGYAQQARRLVHGGPNPKADLRYAGMAGLALALAGDTRQAQRLAADIRRRWPLHWSVQRYWSPIIHAAVALDRKDPNGALLFLGTVSPYERSVLGWPHPVYLRAQAYIMLHNGNAAAVEFQKILDYPGRGNTAGVLARLGLARAYTLQGDVTEARAAYQDFLTLWKDADPDIPILKEAKAEYAKLQ